ncbi:MAG: hypothetical protein LKE39_06410 [Sphaerochaeta sp.]|jgi:hypothetical protein|nr:hypothetical protein [Sphaerochaeta sp.]MCH3920087.1 hypothetical protein [Sphaerochaeta sp.]MCI2046035.1 hypothetical protein [Sphaerochaeta sp.]MCI2076933.1 hypothetical protein [Sphaerochaeta sp.]MCI2096277.1 hypothetical protein [Sphaerochaeta sp.]
MKLKRLFSIMLLCLLCGAVGARSLSTASLQVVGGYLYPGDGGYGAGMQSFDNWHIGGGMAFRFSLMTVEASFLPFSYSDDESKLLILMMPGVSIPLSVVSNLEFGFGPSLGMLVPTKSESDSAFRYELADGSVVDSSTSFGSLLMHSRMYWKIGLSAQVGNFGFHAGYLCPTNLSLSTLRSSPSISDFFRTSEGMLTFALSLDIY